MTLFGDRIFTLRLLLRRINEDDLELIYVWNNSESAYGDYLTPENSTIEELREQLNLGGLWGPKSKYFLITMKDKEEPLGTIHYWLRPENPETAVIALKIAEPKERDKGYGTEAQKYLIMFLFDRLGVANIEMYTDMGNKAQQRCLSKLGFDLIDSLNYSDHHVERTGHLFRLEKDEYAKHLAYQYHYA